MASQDDIDSQLKLLRIHRRNLARYINQRSLHGEANVPPAIDNGIDEERDNIRRVKATLKKWGVSFEDLDTDEEQPTPPRQPDTAPVDFLIIAPLIEERNAILKKLPGSQKLPPSHTDVRVYYAAELPTTFPGGATGTYRIIVTSPSGMGRVQATSVAADALNRWHPRYVILIGIAGGAPPEQRQVNDNGATGGMAAKGVRIGDILIADQIIDYESQKLIGKKKDIRWDVYRVDQRLLPAAQNFDDENWHNLAVEPRPNNGIPKVHFGPIMSGDKVIAYGKALNSLREVWSKLIGVEMEAAGVALRASQTPWNPGFFMVRGVSDLADEQKGEATVEEWRSYACDIVAAYTVALLKSGPVPLTTS